MRALRFWLAVAFATLFTLGASPADAKGSARKKAKLEISAVELSDAASVAKERDKRVRSMIRRFATKSAKHLDFGETGRVEITLLVRELTVAEADGVLRVTCTIVGKLEGGKTAKSRLSFGGKPSRKKELEQQVLGAVTEGVMTRLAMLARKKQDESS